MFKKSVLALAITILSTSALSSPVGNLKVLGDIKPPTCTVNGSSETELFYNFDNISPSIIPQDSVYNGLPELQNSLVIECDAITYLSFKAQDFYNTNIYPAIDWSNNRINATFALMDATNTNNTIGGIEYEIENPEVDGEAVNFSRGNDGIGKAEWGGATRILKGSTMGWTKTENDDVSPQDFDFVPGKIFSATIKNSSSLYKGKTNNTYILPKSKLQEQGVNLSEGIDFVGNTILTFNFGL
ncbi:type 1 fimbria pilin [Providencia alcalifaciens]|nr:type 1 fimbria pilin [Providencia alcalifaciens]